MFRYNTINDGNQNTNPVDAHGNKFFGRGSRTYEIYGNKINSGHSYMGMYIRGGTGVIYDNQFTGDFTRPLTLTMESKNNGAYPAQDQIKDLYLWNNKVNGQQITPHMPEGKPREFVKENRDFFMKKKDGYTSYAYPHPSRGKKTSNVASNSSVLAAIANPFDPLHGVDESQGVWERLLKLLNLEKNG